MKIRIFYIIVATIMIVATSCNKDTDNENQGNGTTGTKVGDLAPDFTLPDKNGNDVRLSDYKGKLVLVDFWASWCHFCRDENPELVALYADYKDKGFEIIGVSTDTDKNDWLGAISSDGIEFVQVSDLMGSSSPVYETYGVISIPRMVLINEEGTILLITGKASDVESIVRQRLD